MHNQFNNVYNNDVSITELFYCYQGNFANYLNESIYHISMFWLVSEPGEAGLHH